MLNIRFTNLYPLWALTSVIAKGKFNPDWSGRYEKIKSGKGFQTIPELGGSCQSIMPIKLLEKPHLPSEISTLDDGRKGFIYIFCSTHYPIIYVGITDGDIRTGVFRDGRFMHHLRKTFACHSSSTSHTTGWQSHAFARYRDRRNSLTAAPHNPENILGSLVGSDLMIAFAPVELPEDPANYEGTVLREICNSSLWGNTNAQVLNLSLIHI